MHYVGIASNFPCDCRDDDGMPVPVFMRGASYARGPAKDCTAPKSPHAEALYDCIRNQMKSLDEVNACNGEERKPFVKTVIANFAHGGNKCKNKI